MKTTKRFENAVMKLYNAFHENRLNAMDCTACAVGNLVGHGNWFGCRFEDEDINNPTVDKKTLHFFDFAVNKSGYSEKELSELEYIFLKEWEKSKTIDGRNKDVQFKGLCAVVEYLAELDNIPNPMDYTKLFETENEQPKYELNF